MAEGQRTISEVQQLRCGNLLKMYVLGDAPACQLEAGHKTGGDYFCWTCNMNAKSGHDLQYMLADEQTDLQFRTKKNSRNKVVFISFNLIKSPSQVF